MTLVDWQERFGLSNWVISLEIDHTLKQNAKTIADPRYQRAKIIVAKDDLAPEEQDRIMIHELIHIVMSMYDFYVDNKIENDDVVAVARENAVSQLGEIFARNIL